MKENLGAIAGMLGFVLVISYHVLLALVFNETLPYNREWMDLIVVLWLLALVLLIIGLTLLGEIKIKRKS